jgi:hypothetical protein
MTMRGRLRSCQVFSPDWRECFVDGGQGKQDILALLYCCRRRGCVLLQRRVWFHATLKARKHQHSTSHQGTLATLKPLVSGQCG